MLGSPDSEAPLSGDAQSGVLIRLRCHRLTFPSRN